MYSFFQYTPVVNYGSEVDNAATVDYHIGADDGMRKDYGTMRYSGSWRNVGCGVNQCGELSTALLNPVYPLHPEGIVAEGGDEKGCWVDVGLECGKRMGWIGIIKNYGRIAQLMSNISYSSTIASCA